MVLCYNSNKYLILQMLKNRSQLNNYLNKLSNSIWYIKGKKAVHKVFLKDNNQIYNKIIYNNKYRQIYKVIKIHYNLIKNEVIHNQVVNKIFFQDLRALN